MSHLEYDVMYGGKTQYEGELKWLRVVYENKTLREEIDCFLADGYKINAIRIFIDANHCRSKNRPLDG